MPEETQKQLMEIYETITELLMGESSTELPKDVTDSLQKAIWELEDFLEI